MNPRNTFALLLLTAGVFAFIFLVEPRFVPVKQEPPKELPKLNTNGVTVVEILTPQFEIRAERTDDLWHLTKPLAYPAESELINKFLEALAALQPKTQITAQELNGQGSVNEEYGFDPPLATLVIKEDGEPRQLKLGKLTAPGDGIYAQVVGGGSVDIIDAAFFKQFVPHAPNDWRNTSFVELKERSFDHLTVANGIQTFELKRDSDTPSWHMVKPVATRADTGKIEDLLNKLRELRVTNFVTDDARADLESYGLQPPVLELKLDQGTNAVLSLQFGKSPATNDAVIYARQSGRNSVVLIPREHIAPWQKSYQDFRDRHLVRFINGLPDTIQALGNGKELFILERRTNDTWQVLPPYDFPADPNLMRLFLTDLSGMEVIRSNNEVAVKDTVLPDADFPRYGLKAPSRSYILKNNGRSTNVMAEIDFGLEEDGKVYARRSDQLDETSLYAVKAADFAKLPASALQLRTRRIWNFLEDDVASVTIRQSGVSHKLIHKAPNKWDNAADKFNELELEVAAEELGVLEAENWIARGDQDRVKYGFTDKFPQLIVDVQIHDKTQTLTLYFGGRSPDGLRYGDVKMDDGQNWIFEFPSVVIARLTEYFHIEEP